MATLAPVLVQARADINTRWPKRDRRSDGWIGDRAHQATKSDHNPDGRGIVHALDVDADGIDAILLVALMIAHPSTQYVIYNRKIYSRTYGFKPRAYTGPNPHTSHIHWSIRHGSTFERSSVRLKLPSLAAPVRTVPVATVTKSWSVTLLQGLPATRARMRGRAVRRDQGLLNLYGYRLRVDGDFGPKTEAAVQNYQSSARLRADGIVGVNTRTSLLKGMALATLQQGQKGHHVRVLQAMCTAFGYVLVTDGDFGPATTKAVRQIQARYGLKQDAIVGRHTWTTLLTR